MQCVYSDRTCFFSLAHATPEIPQALIPVLVSVFWLDSFPLCSPLVGSDSSDDDSQVEDTLAGKNTSKSEPCKATLAC
jgi:hypothetical protein